MAISGSIIPSFSAPKIGGGIGSRASNFVRPKVSSLGDIIETISTPIGGGRGTNTPKISEGLIGFADTFGSPKTAKRIRKGVSSLRDILIESYDLAKILVATVKKTAGTLKGGLFGGKGGGGGLLGGLLGGLMGAALTVKVLAVLKGVIIGAAIFMAGKWLLEMLGILDKNQPQPDDQEKLSVTGSQNNELKSESSDATEDNAALVKPLFGNITETMFPTSEREDSQKGSDSINILFGHTPENEKMRDGGIIKGKSHKEGGENINVEGGEAVLPAKSVKMLGVENILGLIQETNKKNISSSNISDSSEDKSDGFSKDLKSNLVSGNISDGLKPEAVSGTPGVDGVPGMNGVDGKDGSSGVNLIQSKITKVISSEPQKKDPKTIVLPVDSAQSPIELPPQRSRQQIVNPSGSAVNGPDIAFPPSTKSDSFGAFETRMIYNIVGG